MKVYEQVLGNRNDPVWAQSLKSAVIAELVLDGWELKKSRLRHAASDGSDVAINLDRGQSLNDGDILEWDATAGRTLIVRAQPTEVMHVRLEPASPEVMVERALKLGHVLGNQHWAALVQGTSIYVPLAVNKMVMTSVMNTHNLPGVTFSFESGAGLNLPAVSAGNHEHGHNGHGDHSHGDHSHGDHGDGHHHE